MTEKLWIALAVIVIASVILGGITTVKLESTVQNPQSTTPSGQTLFESVRGGR